MVLVVDGGGDCDLCLADVGDFFFFFCCGYGFEV